MTDLQGHFGNLADLEPHVGLLKPGKPVELWTRTHSGIESRMVFDNLDQLLDYVTGEYKGDPCSCLYDEESDTDGASWEEQRVCTFARAVDDFQSWSLDSVSEEPA
jgi:hypothetical protein